MIITYILFLMPTHELEYRIRPRVADGYPVSTQLTIHGQDLIFPDGLLQLNLDQLFNLRTEQQPYNAMLSAAVLQAPHIGEAFEKARTAMQVGTEDSTLRVRLLIESGASELQGVRWECLCDDEGKPLFNGDRILFSRYLVSGELGRGSTKIVRHALIAIANPPHLDRAINPEDPKQGLPAVDVANEKALAEKGLKAAGFDVTTVAAAPYGKVSATLQNILNELENGFDVFYLVCHGGLVPHDPRDGPQKAMLWLDDGEDPVDAAGLVEGIRNMKKQPCLVVLASCQSAGTGGAPSTSASSTLGALGPMLADVGVPAVVAMQGSIRMSTVARFMPEFFEELAKDGQVDRAMGKARGAVGADCPDYWMQTLFMRLSDGVIWPPREEAPPVREPSRRGLLIGAGTAALAALGGALWWKERTPKELQHN